MTPIKNLLREIPITSGLITIVWGLFGYAKLSGATAVQLFGFQPELGLPTWRIITAAFGVGSLHEAFLATLAMCCLSIPTEYLLGSTRFALAIVVINAFSVPVGMIVARAAEPLNILRWGAFLRSDHLLSPLSWVFGTAAIASAAMPTLWRRRTRLLLLSLSLSLILFSGTMQDFVLLVAVVVGLLIGQIQLGGREYHPTRLRLRPPSLRETRILVALYLMCIAMGPVIVALNPQAQGPFSTATSLMWEPKATPEEITAVCQSPMTYECQTVLALAYRSGIGPVIANLLPLFAQVIISFGLMWGRRLAWIAALVVQSGAVATVVIQICRLYQGNVSTTTAIIHGLGLGLPWLVGIVLILRTRHVFFVKANPKILVRAGAIIAATFAFTAGGWILGVALLEGDFFFYESLVMAFKELPTRYFPPAWFAVFDHYLLPESTLSWWLYESVGVVFWLVVLSILLHCFLTPEVSDSTTDRGRAEALLRRGTGDHLSWMGLWQGNRYWFAHDISGNALGYVAYRLQRNVAVTVGEPVVLAIADKPTVANQFEAYCEAHGFTVAWYSVREEFAVSRSCSHFKKVNVAEESVLPVSAMDFKGKRFQNIRTARNRAVKEQITTTWCSWEEIGVELQQRIIALSEEWVAEKPLPEMGFTLGSVNELRVPGTRLLFALETDGTLAGITSWLPVYEDGIIAGYTLDFMRRGTGFRPVIELLISEGLIQAAREGCKWISLSGAPLAPPTSASESSGVLGSALDKAGEAMEPLYGFRSLAASKYKFHPEHQTWYLCYQDELALPNIGIAISQCYLPQFAARDAVAAFQTWSEAHRAST